MTANIMKFQPLHQPLPAYQIRQTPQHHDHRLNKKAPGGEDVWRDLPSRGADINLLSNSLTSRLRKAARQRLVTSSAPPTSAGTYSSVGSLPPAERKGSSAGRGSGQPVSILKRPAGQRGSFLGEDGGEDSPYFDLHLPRVDTSPPHQHHNHRHPSASSAGTVESATSGHSSTLTPTLTPTPTPLPQQGAVSQGPMIWVKRAGIFQPADKYAGGRPSLFGDDLPFQRSVAVDYETVTLPSRPPSSGHSSSSWSASSSAKQQRRKGLKVSWQKPDVEGRVQDGEDGAGARGDGGRQRSAASDAAYRRSKPRFTPARSRVPSIGLKWKVGRPGAGGSSSTSSGSASSSGQSSPHSSPPSSTTAASSLPSSSSSLLPPAAPGKPRDVPGHPWRALYPRDVHPVTTAMEREGTSVSKTKWSVPGLRPQPAYTFIEDLLESRCRQWNPALHPPTRQPTRATLDARSMQARHAATAHVTAPSSTITAATTNTGASSSITTTTINTNSHTDVSNRS